MDHDRTPSAPPAMPYIAATTHLPEITPKAIVLAVFLAAILAGANAYLGLLAGMTVSASIPAAVISMAALRLFPRSNILENNIVQTAASAGESLAAGVIFTFPALIILGAWDRFSYLETTIIAGLGGLIGVLFTIPLRRALIVESTLGFPEGVATAEVLKVGERALHRPSDPEATAAAGSTGIGAILAGGGIGALFKFGESGLGLWPATAEFATRAGKTLVYGGTNLLPALVAVGYIVGLNIAVLVFVGGAMNWLVAIPVYAATHEWPESVSAMDRAWEIWSTQTRYLGVGAMVVGGLWALIRLIRPLVSGISASFVAYREMRLGTAERVPRTEQDAPMNIVLILIGLSVIPLFFVFHEITGSVGVSAFMAVVMLIAGFLFSAVAAYMAGLVGSSNNPISGVTIATVLMSSLLLVVLIGRESDVGAAAAILIGSVVCCAAAIGGDNMQDLKAGHLLGATPRKQQIMQVIGVVAAALVMAPVLQLLLDAYGIGGGEGELAAPQATLMASVARGVFANDLPWGMVAIGAGIAVIIIMIDLVLEARKAEFRMPVLAVAVGIYLPFELAVPILAGGLIAWAAGRRHKARGLTGVVSLQRGLLFAAGLITGEALLGILLAIPIVANKGVNPLNLGITASPWPGIVLLVVVMAALYAIAAKRRAA